MIKKIFFALATITMIHAPSWGLIVTRAAVDIGSGTTKITIADVDLDNQCIEKVHYTEEINMPLKKDMEMSGKLLFSKEIQEKLIKVLAKWKNEYPQTFIEWSGVGTAASRQSQNAQQMYDRIYKELKIPIKIIPQDEEGRLGFAVSSAVSGYPQDILVSYDSGGASFQISTLFNGNLEIIQGDIGGTNALTTFLSEVRKQSLKDFKTCNPVRLEEAKILMHLLMKKMPALSEQFKEKLRSVDTHVVGIGTLGCIFDCGAIGTGKQIYSRDKLWKAIEHFCDKSDEYFHNFHNPREAVVRMVLLYTVMENLGINKISYYHANGCCEALLLDEKYWVNDNSNIDAA